MDNNQQNGYQEQPTYQQPTYQQPAYQQQPDYQPQPAYDAQPVASKPSGKSIASMICGLLGLGMDWAYGIPGLILGIVAVILAKKGLDGSNKSVGFCKCGKITGIISIVGGAIIFVVMIIGIVALTSSSRYY